jgi:putative oxidoreductase
VSNAVKVKSVALSISEWGLRLLLAAVFVYAGMQKFPSAPGAPWVKVFDNIGIGQWFRYFTGIVEVVGGCLVAAPRATSIAVPLLACTMVGAFLVHLAVVGTGPQTIAVSVLLAALLAVWLLHRRRSAGLADHT